MFHFMVKPRPFEVHGLGNARKGGGLLGHGEGAGDLVGQLVEAADEVDGLQVFVAAELVGNPFAGLARVVEVEHGRDRIHAQAVDVVFLQPEEGVRDQESAHLVAAVVEDQGAPVAMLALAWIGVFVERRAVEEGQAVGVFGEVGGNPIDDHAEAGLVAAVHQVLEIVGRAEARGGREIADHLVAPRAGERMLHDGQQLDVRVAHRRAYSTSLTAISR